MNTTLITEEMLQKIILGVVNAEGEKYWIKSINRASRSTLKGTVVEVAPNEENGGGNSTLIFDKFSLIVEGDLKKYESEINKEYIDTLCTLSAEFKAFFDDAMLKIDEKTAEFRLRLVENFYENGYVKNDIKGVFKGVGVADLQARLEKNKHSEWIAPIDNKLKKVKRTFNSGDIYSADLNPVLPNEFGGIRPVLILSSFDRFVTIVPISTVLDSNEPHYILPANSVKNEKNFDFNNNDASICTYTVKTISKERLFHKLAILPKEHLDKVFDLVAENLFGKDFKTVNVNVNTFFDEAEKFDIEIPFSDEEVAEYEAQLNAEFGLTSDLNKPQQVQQEDLKPKRYETYYAPVEDEKKKFVQFVLTEDEARQIAEKKIQYVKNMQRGYEIDNLQLVDINNDGNYLFTADGYFTKTKEALAKAEIRIGKFYGQFSMGYKEHKNDYNINQFIYSTMFEKYGEDYRKYFVINHMQIANTRHMKGFNYLPLSENFRRALAIAGYKAKDLEKIIQDGIIDFEADLEPLVPHYEEENISMEDVVNSMDSVEKSDKPIQKPVTKNENSIDFELTDEEAMEIANAKINRMWEQGSKLSFYNPAVSGDGFVKNGVDILFNQGHTDPRKGIFPTTFELKPFFANVKIGDRCIANNYDLLEFMAKKLSEKYPDRYPRLFAKTYIDNQNAFYEKFRDLDKCCEKLTKYLSFIGKKAHDVEELVRYGLGAYKFEELVDISDENE